MIEDVQIFEISIKNEGTLFELRMQIIKDGFLQDYNFIAMKIDENLQNMIDDIKKIKDPNA